MCWTLTHSGLMQLMHSWTNSGQCERQRANDTRWYVSDDDGKDSSLQCAFFCGFFRGFGHDGLEPKHNAHDRVGRVPEVYRARPNHHG